MSWNKESSNKDGRKIGEPHPEWRMNYSFWRDWLSLPNSRRTISHADIWEYYIVNGKTFRIVIWDPKNNNGTLKRIVGNRNSKEDINPMGIPLYCLLSWKDKKNQLCCCDVNFHEEHGKFKNHMNFYLNIEKEPENGWDNGLFER